MRAQIAANSGRFALNWEISVCAGLRGGPGSTRTDVDCIGDFPKCDNSGSIKPQKEFPAAVSPIVIPATNKKKSPSIFGGSDEPVTELWCEGSEAIIALNEFTYACKNYLPRITEEADRQEALRIVTEMLADKKAKAA